MNALSEVRYYCEHCCKHRQAVSAPPWKEWLCADCGTPIRMAMRSSPAPLPSPSGQPGAAAVRDCRGGRDHACSRLEAHYACGCLTSSLRGEFARRKAHALRCLGDKIRGVAGEVDRIAAQVAGGAAQDDPPHILCDREASTLGRLFGELIVLGRDLRSKGVAL